jgi:hypothetical protein
MSQSTANPMWQATLAVAKLKGWVPSRRPQPSPIAPPPAPVAGYFDPLSNRTGMVTGAAGAEAPSPGAKALLGQ